MYSPQANSSFSYSVNMQGRNISSNNDNNRIFVPNQISFQNGANINLSNRSFQRPQSQIKQTQMSNASYVVNKSQTPRNENTGSKLTQMSSDLAKLKQQLNKIMSQADKFEKKQVNRNQSQFDNQQATFFNDQKIKNPQRPISNDYINKVGQKHIQGEDKLPYYRVTQPSQNLINGSLSSSNIKLNSLNSSISNQQKVIHSESQKKFITNNKINNNIIVNNNYRIEDKIKKNPQYLQNNILSRPQANKIIQQEWNPSNYNKKQLSFNLNQNLKNQNKVKEQTKINNVFNTSEPNKTKNQIIDLNNKKKLDNTKYSDQSFLTNLITKNNDFSLNKSVNSDLQNKNQWSFSNFSKQKSSRTQSSPIYQANSISGFPKPQQQQQMLSSSQKSASLSSTFLTKKDSSKSESNQQILNKIMNQQLSKKIERNTEASLLKQQKAKQQLQYQQKIISLEHENRKLKHQLNSSLLEKQNIQLLLKTQKSQRENVLKKYNQIETVLLENRREVQQYKTKCKILQTKLQAQMSRPKNQRKNEVTSSFDQALKQQISQINAYKQKLQLKDQQINRLKDLGTMNRRQIQSLNNQIKIQQIKAVSQLNQTEQKNSVLLQDKQNQLKSYKNLIQTLQAKLSFAVKQNKTKDAFMVQHLTGKAKTADQKQYIEQFFKSYEVEFPTNRFAQKIKQEQLEIQKLKKTIVQMAIKQR